METLELCVTKTHFTELYNRSFKEPVYLNGSQFKGMMRNGVIQFSKYPNLSISLDANGYLKIFKKVDNTLEEFVIKYYDGAPAIEVYHEKRYVRLRPHRIMLDLFLGRLEQKVLPINEKWDPNEQLNIFNMRFPYKGEHSKHLNKKKREEQTHEENNVESLKTIQNSLKDVIDNIKGMVNFNIPEITFSIKEEGEKTIDKITEMYNSVKRNLSEHIDNFNKQDNQTVTIQIGDKTVMITGQNIKVEIKDK